MDEIPGGGLRVALASGDVIELLPGVVELYGEIVLPDELLLLGTTDSGVIGFVTLSGMLDACYIINEPAIDDGTHILFDWGLRLPKARDFDPGPVRDGRFRSFREGFCLNGDGEVVGYGYGF